VGDTHGIASNYNNQGLLLLAEKKCNEAKPLFAQAVLIFAQMDASEAQTAGTGLVQACGSPQAAEEYIQQYVADARSADQLTQPEEGMSLEQLFALVAQTRQGDRVLGEQLYHSLLSMSVDASVPVDMQNLAKVLINVVLGSKNPDLSTLTNEYAAAVRDLL